MTSKIKVDNINKVSDDTNIIKKCGTTTTIGSGASNPIVVDGSAVTIGRCGGTVALASGATQTGFGRTGTVDWQTTPKTGDFTAVNGEGYFCNTTSGAITMTMPSGSAGAIVSIQDYNKTFDSNALTITPASGEKINGGTADGNLRINTEGQGLTFVYVDATVGWKTVHENEFTSGGSSFIIATGGTITQSGNCRIHTFTGPGSFAVSAIAACATQNVVSYLVVGGGGGTHDDNSGGGGGGGYREVKSPVTPYTASNLDGYPSAPNRITITAASFPIQVGAGGAKSPPSCHTGDGTPSIFSTIVGTGGGAGECQGTSGRAGGSGGGGGSRCTSGGAGNTPPTSPAQGQNGGNGAPPAGGGAGGGGADSVGSNAPSGGGGNGGNGVATEITASPVTYSGGGGGGGGQPGGQPGGSAGSGGAGAGGSGTSAGTAGTANTGGGAGGGGQSGGGAAGGSGIVVIRYKFQ